MDHFLGEHCHLITMKGWRHGKCTDLPPPHPTTASPDAGAPAPAGPGHGGNKSPVGKPGVEAGGFHCDEMWLPPDLPSEVTTQLGPYLADTVHVRIQLAPRPRRFPSLLRRLSDGPLPAQIIGTLTYLNGTTPECCPTCVQPLLRFLPKPQRSCCRRVIPGSFRSCRRPKPGETSFEGRGPLTAIAEPGDTLLFRSDVWRKIATLSRFALPASR